MNNNSKITRFLSNHRASIITFGLMCLCINFADAQTINAGATKLSGVAASIAEYLPAVKKIVYAIAGIIAVIGAISVYIKMNNEDQDVKKSILMIVGACIFLVAAVNILPAFFV